MVIALLMITALGLAGFTSFENIKHHTDILGTGFMWVAHLSVLTFWHNILMEKIGYFNYAMNIYWSLSVEEVFYLAYPLVLLICRKRWQILGLAFLCIVVAPLYRNLYKDNELFYLYGNIACLDVLAFGCIAAILAQHLSWPIKWRILLAGLSFIIMVWVYLRGIYGHEVFGSSFLGMATAVFLMSVSRLPRPKWHRPAAPLAWLGAHSYELYLFHIILLGLLLAFIPRGQMEVAAKLPVFLLFLCTSALFAWVMARFCGDKLNAGLRRRVAARIGA